jgi:hypothetical protein
LSEDRLLLRRFRRGSDIVKALAIGAKAVCIGRPYLWGLGAFGESGVERVLAILRDAQRDAAAWRAVAERPDAGNGAAGLEPGGVLTNRA